MFYMIDGGGFMNYKVVSLNGGNQFDLNGVRFDGKNFIFWKNKNASVISEVIVVFNQKYGNQKLKNGTCVLSLQGLNNYNDIMSAIMVFKEIYKGVKIKFNFIVESEKEEELVSSLGEGLRLDYAVWNANKREKKDKESNLKKMEESVKNDSNSLTGNGDKIVEKYDNGNLRQVTIHNDIAYENLGSLNSEEEKVSLLREWMQDPVKARELASMSDEARNNLLMEAISVNKREYRLESASELGEQTTDLGQASLDMANDYDSKVNANLGIGVSNDDRDKVKAAYTAGDKVQMVAPSVKGFEIGTNGIGVESGNDSNWTSSSVDSDNNDSIKEDEIQPRDYNVGEFSFYVDGDGYIFGMNDLDNAIGKNGDGVFEVVYDNDVRMLFVNNKFEGNVRDYPDELKRQNAKGRTLVYKKERRDYGSDRDNGGFVNVPIIIFVISFLLLVGSGIILFLMK